MCCVPIKIVSIGEGGKGKVNNTKNKKNEGNQDKIIRIAVHYYRYSPSQHPISVFNIFLHTPAQIHNWGTSCFFLNIYFSFFIIKSLAIF